MRPLLFLENLGTKYPKGIHETTAFSRKPGTKYPKKQRHSSEEQIPHSHRREDLKIQNLTELYKFMTTVPRRFCQMRLLVIFPILCSVKVEKS